jgi:hypothetical protein
MPPLAGLLSPAQGRLLSPGTSRLLAAVTLMPSPLTPSRLPGCVTTADAGPRPPPSPAPPSLAGHALVPPSSLGPRLELRTKISLIELRTQEDGQESRDIFPPVPSSQTGASRVPYHWKGPRLELRTKKTSWRPTSAANGHPLLQNEANNGCSSGFTLRTRITLSAQGGNTRAKPRGHSCRVRYNPLLLQHSVHLETPTSGPSPSSYSSNMLTSSSPRTVMDRGAGMVRLRSASQSKPAATCQAGLADRCGDVAPLNHGWLRISFAPSFKFPSLRERSEVRSFEIRSLQGIVQDHKSCPADDDGKLATYRASFLMCRGYSIFPARMA